MLKVDSIYKSFYQKRVLEDISFDIPKGQITGLLGPNGAGKTTLLRIINRIVEPEQGAVFFGDQRMNDSHLASIGYLPEERGLYRAMTVEEHAVFLGRLRGMNRRDVNQQLHFWLERFGIVDWKKKRIEELSKGMAQKVQFLCTVLHQPDILILDEPFSGFDPINVELVRKELNAFKKAGKTIILSTHNMKSVEELCDSAVLIHEGKKVLEGKILNLRETHKEGLFEIIFKGNMIALANALWVSFELVKKEEITKNTFKVYLKIRGENNFNDLLKTVLPHVEIISVQEVLPSMEEVFMSTIHKEKELVDE